MTDFLLELRSEEIPARMQAKAAADLARLFTEQLAAAGLAATETQTFVTPRRLALIARGLPEATEAQSEEIKGPRTSAPPQALEGFLGKTGLQQSDLEDRDGIWFASKQTPGRDTRDVLAEAIPAIVRAFPWPKSMRWGAASTSTESLRWVRPLHGIVAIFGSDLVPCTIGDVTSGYETLGHRFHHPGVITIGGADDYAEKLRACHIIVDAEERRAIIRDGAKQLAADQGLDWILDEALVAENAGLTEWPVPLIGSFDPDFLSVPREVIQLTLATNQKYFVLESPPHANGEGDRPQGGGGGAEGAAQRLPQLAPAFICVANIDANDGGAAIVDGNRKVLAARLSDARHFWDQDRKKTLAQHAGGLARITFHEKLGTVADKVDRVARLARWLVEEGIVKVPPRNGEGDHAKHGGGVVSPSATPDETRPSVTSADAAAPPPRTGEELSRAQLATLVEQAARLAKADLVTEMVGEFPELQGVIGGYYARAEGLDPQVADAIRDHYKPVGQGDDVPTAPVTVAVSLADKLDTLVGFFLIDERPTGSRDPFALRRAALGVLEILNRNALRMGLWEAITRSLGGFAPQKLSPETGDENYEAYIAAQNDVFAKLPNFLADRLKVQQREAGVRHDLIDAVFALGGEDDLVRLLARVKALQAFIETPEGTNLLAGYKRAANILKKEDWGDPDTNGAHPEPVEGSSEGLRQAQPGRERDNSLSYTLENAEAALVAALDSAEPAARDAIANEDFAAAMAALASLRAPIDTFFEEVIVNDPDPDKRAARLRLLARIRSAVHAVADFSRIEG
ncbi:glycine--tRNA ligase subunit beta [Sphingorhabdus soli]|uniref:Glycine--tRNA ligase beta subunit n=1 Tax=Flavisphingopyxis soli TaxID=2601267 RepID=A0A5C6U8X3_9SPHN|nr:glycine--tRNA ligase subunit beta [Sphingorhabdus soli]TXC68850.1 glycine--tRNA ligase subunit beta [Sphingorhabdus soli]